MKKIGMRALLGTSLTLAMVLLLAAGVSVAEDKAAPADLTYENATLGNVVFSHKAHLASDAVKDCTTCHTALFEQKKSQGVMKMAAMNEGKLCGSCHKAGGSAAKADVKTACMACHKK
jgi:c(7)-type cytochrome triheme protein